MSASDIAANFDQYGNYELWLKIGTKSAVVKLGGPYLPASQGWYDNISIDVAVKKYKTVHEILGSSGQLGSEARVSRSGAVTLAESYSTEVYSPTFNYETASGVVGLVESLASSMKRTQSIAEGAGLIEAVQAKRTQGNRETTYILEDLTQWTEISKTETPWVKIKTVIGGN